jgi:hypothetical protein
MGNAGIIFLHKLLPEEAIGNLVEETIEEESLVSCVPVLQAHEPWATTSSLPAWQKVSESGGKGKEARHVHARGVTSKNIFFRDERLKVPLHYLY